MNASYFELTNNQNYGGFDQMVSHVLSHDPANRPESPNALL